MNMARQRETGSDEKLMNKARHRERREERTDW